MGLWCKVFGHNDEALNFWGEQANYILFRCTRCHQEHIVCSHEKRCIPNDEFGKMVLNKMMTDDVFSNACRLHMEFVEVEKKYPFAFITRESQLNRLRENYGLPPNYRPACPVEMLKAGLWKDKEKISNNKPELRFIEISNSSSPDKQDIEKGELINLNLKDKAMEEKKFEYTNEVQVVYYEFEKKPSKTETLAELEKLEKIYVEKENYEKAAEIHKRIQQLKNIKS